jgi:hypothetical protein
MEKRIAKELLKNLDGKKSLELIKLFSKDKVISLDDIAKRLKIDVKEIRGYLADITKELKKITKEDGSWYSIERRWIISKDMADAINQAIKENI